MALLTVGGALSHSPLINVEPVVEDAAAVARYHTGALQLGARVSGADVLIVIGQDHFRTLFYDLMPPFVIGVGRVEGWGDWGTPKGELATHEALARSLHRGLLARGFDLACSYDLRVDHGVTQPLQLMGLRQDLPVLPILINTGAPPLPSPQRCYDLGLALGEAVAACAGDLKVAVVASGGLSHSPPAADVEREIEAAGVLSAKAVHGRAAVAGDEAARRRRLTEAVRAGRFAGSVRPDWDRMILGQFADGEGARLAAQLTETSIERDGGCGGQEIRTWLAAAGACRGAPAEILAYEPIASLITGMGVVHFQ